MTIWERALPREVISGFLKESSLNEAKTIDIWRMME
jgi:hypothetical protein